MNKVEDDIVAFDPRFGDRRLFFAIDQPGLDGLPLVLNLQTEWKRSTGTVQPALPQAAADVHRRFLPGDRRGGEAKKTQTDEYQLMHMRHDTVSRG